VASENGVGTQPGDGQMARWLLLARSQTRTGIPPIPCPAPFVMPATVWRRRCKSRARPHGLRRGVDNCPQPATQRPCLFQSIEVPSHSNTERGLVSRVDTRAPIHESDHLESLMEPGAPSVLPQHSGARLIGARQKPPDLSEAIVLAIVAEDLSSDGTGSRRRPIAHRADTGCRRHCLSRASSTSRRASRRRLPYE